MLTAEQKSQVLYFLGFPGSTLTHGNVNYNSVVNSRLNGLDEFTEERVVDLLEKLELNENKYGDTAGKSHVTRIDDIELDYKAGDAAINREGTRLKSKLSTLLDIPSKGRGGMMANVRW